MLSTRMSALAGFAALGVFWGAWGAALPAVQRRSGADDADLGLALFVLGLGALVSMRATGVLIDRVGPRVTPVTVGLLGLCAVLPALAGSPLQLGGALFLVGAASGALDVAINADAVREEEAADRPLLNLAHAWFSAAVVLASLTTGLVRWAGGGPGVVFALAAGAVLAVGVAVWTSVPAGWSRPAEAERPRFLGRIPGWLLLLGVLGAVAYWIENAWQTWGAVHLERTLDAPAELSALGPALFAAAMAGGRVAVHLVSRAGAERVVLVGGALVAALGSAGAAVAPSVPVALAGIVVAGSGCAVLAPTVVSLAGRAAGHHERGTVVGSLTTLMYLGFLVGPAAVGGVAQATSLRSSLAAVAGLAALLALLFLVSPYPTPAARARSTAASTPSRQGSP